MTGRYKWSRLGFRLYSWWDDLYIERGGVGPVQGVGRISSGVLCSVLVTQLRIAMERVQCGVAILD